MAVVAAPYFDGGGSVFYRIISGWLVVRGRTFVLGV